MFCISVSRQWHTATAVWSSWRTGSRCTSAAVLVFSKVPFTPATMSKQHCRVLQVARFFRQSRMLLRQSWTLLRNCCRGWQQCRTSCSWNFIFSTKSEQIEHVQFVSTLSKGRNVTIESFDNVAVCGNKVESCFDFDNVACCFDIVAGVDWA